MPAPSIDIVHLKTSRQYEGSTLINRYWFQWQNRRNLGNTAVRLELLDASGTILTTATVRLPKVKITGYTPAPDGKSQQPIYSCSVWIKLDDAPRTPPPTHVRYCTVNVFTKSYTVQQPMNGTYEDISYYG